ncbi:MAG: cyclic nucleotide-binding domain-containing protein [Actinomycetota bacterium]|nr:cyclic nucleotide-binding domain-containing protein [Actinomycetota bacterium]
MSSPDTPQVAQVPMFDGLSDEELRRIVKAGTEVSIPANWSLMWQRTPADKAYIVLDGELSVRKGKDEIARLGPGDIVGEAAIVNHKLRNASVVSVTPVQVLHFTREAVEELCREIPTFKTALETAAKGRIGDTSKDS